MRPDGRWVAAGLVILGLAAIGAAVHPASLAALRGDAAMRAFAGFAAAVGGVSAAWLAGVALLAQEGRGGGDEP